MKAPIIIEAKRNGKWEPSNPELYPIHATKGTLKAMADLGYTRIRVEGGRIEHSIPALLEASRG